MILFTSFLLLLSLSLPFIAYYLERNNSMLKDSKFYFACSVLGFIEVMIICLSISCSAKASPIFDMPLPVGIPDLQNMQNDIGGSVVPTVKDTYLDMLLNQYQNDVSDSYIIIVGYDEPNNTPTYHFTCFNLPSVYLSPFNSSGTMTYLNNGQHYVDIDYNPATQTFGQPYFYGGWVNNWNYTYTDLTTNGTGWVVDMAYDNLFDYYNNNPVWTKSGDSADYDVIPPEDINDFNPDPYSPPSMPQWDPNKSIIENLYDVVAWIGDLILYGFEYIGKLIIGFLQNIIDNIKSFLQNFYDNLVSFFKPFFDAIKGLISGIKDKIDYITEPLDIDTLDNALGDTEFFGIKEDFISAFDDFEDIVNISEPETFIITIHLEDIPVLNMQTYYLNLGSNIIPYRNLLRRFLWALITVGILFVVEKNLPDWLKGSSGGKDGK